MKESRGEGIDEEQEDHGEKPKKKRFMKKNRNIDEDTNEGEENADTGAKEYDPFETKGYDPDAVAGEGEKMEEEKGENKGDENTL